MSLRRQRKAARLTQAELAKRAKVTQGTISKIESGELLRPSFDILNKLAVVLQRCGRRVTEAQLQPRRQPLLIKGARSERRGGTRRVA
jgi:transcriptional regulator with XRE-family HTH domain